jgi:hypothetical protein
VTLLEEGEEGIEAGAEAILPRVGVGERRVQALDQLVDVRLEHRPVELALRVEVLVQERLRDARALGDLIERGSVIAALGERLARGLEDQRAAVGRGHPPPRSRRPAVSFALSLCDRCHRANHLTD